MRGSLTLGLAVACGLVLVAGCGGGGEAAEGAAAEPPAMPFERIAAGGLDPAGNGPDDDTWIKGELGGLGHIRFKHATHASNAAKGYGVPCLRCHHTGKPGEDPETGCLECHALPKLGDDPADRGPEDNLWLVGDDQDVSRIDPVPFNHYTHGSARGYKLACVTCHHTGDFLPCTECHGEIAKLGAEGQVVPKAKRAFHLRCLGCHDALAQNQPDTVAPTDCMDCHTSEAPDALAGRRTLNRALHEMCIDCHFAVAQAKPGTKAPSRNCSGCHARGPKLVKFAFGAEKKPTKNLSHFAHQAYGPCQDCHHEGLDDPTCDSADCHKPAESKDLFHGLCKDGCHTKRGGPVACTDCH